MLSRMRSRKGFTLIELMVVVAIIGILAAIAIPMYRTQQIKAKMTEGTRAVSSVASAIGDYYQDEGGFPDFAADLAIAGINNTLGVGVSTLRYIQAMTVRDLTGVIEVQYQNISSDVDNNWLVLTPSTSPNGAVEWTWSGSGMAQKYIPKE